MNVAGGERNLGAWVWLCIAGFAVFELVAHPLFVRAVPDEASWAEAAAFVRERVTPGDRIVAAPGWVDPIVRRTLGDLQTLRAAAPPDLAGIERVWEVGIRGATTRESAPVLERRFGGVHVRMWTIDSPTLDYDFVEHVREATVELDMPGGPRDCPWSHGRPDRGGLERGPMRPAERFVCGSGHSWVGATIMTDLEFRPRRCIWQHPVGPDPVRARFSEVPLAGRLVVHGGVDHQASRKRRGAPVTLRVYIDDRLAGELVAHDGDGWSELTIDLGVGPQRVGNVRFETTASNPAARRFCYAASIQSGFDDE